MTSLRSPAGRSAALALVLVAVACFPSPALAAAAENVNLLHQLDGALQRVVARVSPSVVLILVTGFGPAEPDVAADRSVLTRQHTLASGVIVDRDGFVITNHHVVRGAHRIRVLLPSPPGDTSARASGSTRQRVYEARVVGVHPETDLALLKIEAHGLPALPLAADRPVHAGQLVFAVGSPLGLASTVTMGVISSPARQADLPTPMLVIQTDAPINPGNSGGPLVDIDGQVVGVNAFIYSQSGGSQGLGFAIPASAVKFVYEALRKRGHVPRVELGIGVQAVTPVLAAGLRLDRDWGVIVSDVAPGGPAERAGVRANDLVDSVDGRPVDTLAALATGMYLHAPGSSVKLGVRRDGRSLVLEVHGVEPSDVTEQLIAAASTERNFLPKLGFAGVAVDDRLAALASSLRTKSGVVVAARVMDPSAVESGLEPGDVIHAVNGTSITTMEALRSAIGALRDGSAVVLQIERQGKLQYLAFEME
jgi:serine protease Do